ncbi:MAG TPA: hypothetical protein VJR92_06465 [Gemmatimonadaceae bacterium]|nr:hypothetical protein [Gemmatimonadaceae bacterium]
MNTTHRVGLRVTALLLATPCILAAQDGGGFRIVKKIPVGGAGTSWDYTLADAPSHRLYVSHGTEAVVIDTERDSVIGRVSPTPGIHGIAVANELNRGFTSNGRDTSVTIFNLKTLEIIGVVKVTGLNPDAIWYDDVTKRVFTMNAAGSSTVIDAAKGEVVGTIPLPGKPEFAQTDGKGLIFITIETDTGQILVADAKAVKEVRRYSLDGCVRPRGLAIDRRANRLFSSCENSVLVVSDLSAGKLVATIPICTGTDAAAYDPDLHLIFAPCSDGNMTVIRQDGADTYTSLGNAKTQLRSRTMAYDVRTHTAYLAAVDVGPAPPPDSAAAAGRGGRGRGAPAIPGSFSVLVLKKQ